MSGNRSKSAFFEGAWVTLNADFRGKGASPTNHSWYQSSRVIALSYGIKISAMRHLVLSQSTRVTDRRTDRQNYDSEDRPRICSRGNKTEIKLKQNKRKTMFCFSKIALFLFYFSFISDVTTV